MHSYTTTNGLPSSTINAIAQDSLGNMWFATRAGVSKYDGYEWHNYRSVDGIAGADFIAIEIDNTNRPWALCRFNYLQVYYLDHDSWKKLPDPPINKRHRYRVRGFVTTEFNGKPVITIAVDQMGLYIWYDNFWHHVNELDGLPSLNINAITADSYLVYLATDSGLAVIQATAILGGFGDSWDLPTHKIVGLAMKDVEPNAIPNDAARLWLAGENWLGYSDKDCFHPLDLPAEKTWTSSLVVVDDRRGGVYLASDSLISHINGRDNTRTIFDQSSGLFEEKITEVFVDVEHNTWIAHTGGLNKMPGRRFANYRRQHGMLSDAVESAWQRSDGRLYFGHRKGFTVFENGQPTAHLLPKEIRDNRRYTKLEDFAEDSAGHLWAASTTLGLLKIDQQDRVELYLPPPEDAIVISAVAVDQEDNIWVGTDAGLYRLQDKSYEKVLLPVSRKVYVREIVTATDDRLLLATPEHGIFQLQDNTISNYRQPSQSGANNVYAIHQDGVGTIWAGTFAGLYFVDGDSLRFFQDQYVQIENHVYTILQDDRERFWYGTDSGLLRRDGVKVEAFGVRDGLIGPETSRSAGLVDADNNVWIGTPNGLSCFRSRYDNSAVAPRPQLNLGRIEVGQTSYTPSQDLFLETDQNKIKFNFKAASFIDERAVVYEFLLEGFDRQAAFTDQPTVEYTNLPSGKFHFQVRAANAAGIWSAWQKTPSISIAAPFVETAWFYITLVLLATVFGYFGHYLKSKETYMRRLEKELHEQTHELRSSEEKYRSLFEDSEDVVFISTFTGHFLDINPAGIKLFGYPSRKAIMKADLTSEIFAKPDEWQSLVAALKEHGNVRNIEVVMKHQSGEQIYALVSGTCLFDSHQTLIGFRGIIRDITEHRQLEQQFYLAQKMESIGLLAGGIAHDFNNILSSILGYASLMKETLPAESEEQTYIDTIEKSADRGAELTSQLLGFARGGKYDLCPVDLHEIIDDTLGMIARTFDKNIGIERRLANEPAIVEGDETQLQQVLLNLCVNARDAMPNGGRLLVHTEHIDDTSRLPNPLAKTGRSFIRLAIQDTGSGMNKATQERIFEPFFTTKQVDRGTGLGLSMAYGVIKNHSGWIQVESQPGRGTTFEVFLPTTEKQVPIKAISQESETSGTETILVVDDEKIIRQMLQESLNRAGYSVIPAEDGETALAIMTDQHDKIDLIILDMIMPRMNGVKTLSELEKITAKSKVLIATGYSKPVEVEQLTGKISGILQKPFKVHTLLTKVRTILDEDD